MTNKIQCPTCGGTGCQADERDRLMALVANDAWAMSFQTMGQYRSALMAAIRNQPKKNADGEISHHRAPD